MKSHLAKFAILFATLSLLSSGKVARSESDVPVSFEKIATASEVIARAECTARTLQATGELDYVELTYSFHLSQPPQFGALNSDFRLKFVRTSSEADLGSILGSFDFRVGQEYFLALSRKVSDTAFFKVTGGSCGVFPIYRDSLGKEEVRSHSVILLPASQRVSSSEAGSNTITSVGEFIKLASSSAVRREK